MHATITTDGTLQISLHGILEHLDPESAETLIEALSVADPVIDAIGQQILTGWTEQMSCAAHMEGSADPQTAMDRLLRGLAKSIGDIVRLEIEHLETSLRTERANNRQLHNELRSYKTSY